MREVPDLPPSGLKIRAAATDTFVDTRRGETEHMHEHGHLQDEARLDAVGWVGESILTLDAAFDRVTRLLAHVTGASLAAFALVGAEQQFVPSAYGLDDLEDTDAVADTLSRACIEGHGMLVVPDARIDFRFADSATVMGPPYLRFYAGLPIHAPNGLVVGTLFVVDQRPRELSAMAAAAFTDLAATLEEMILLRTLALRDSGTGLYTRRYFDELLEREWRRSARTALPLTLMSIDIDRFTAYNDDCGALAGELALKAVSAALQECFGRGGDIVARTAGATFAVLLPETDPTGAALLAERARAAVTSLNLEHRSAPDGLLTVSIGAVCAAPTAEHPGVDDLMLRAADALRSAKQAGRDRAELLDLGAGPAA
ncbi:MAG: diguanylate cyclase domain-containing protein [Sporichthyaceae bacterium]